MACLAVFYVAFLAFVRYGDADAKPDAQVNEPQTYQPTYNKEYQPRYNPLYTNTQQGSLGSQYDNPLISSQQDQQNPQQGGGGLLVGPPNQNNFYDQSSNALGSGNTGGIYGTGGSGISNYDPFNRGSTSTGFDYIDNEVQNYCPEHWISFRQTCYRFIRSPKRNWLEAKKICKAYNAELLNVDSIEKHSFILKQLIIQNQRQNRFWISARQTGPNSWANDDNSPFLVLEDSFAFDEDQSFENENLHDNRFLVQNMYQTDYNRNNPNQFYNTMPGSINTRNQNNLRGFFGTM